ncbi:Ribosomal protein S27E [Aspergillus oryzae]|uniref:40S ribosomal protein S27 n=1 Tax=Aspergillus oryzae TaxID=5062 RepID=A0A1S9DIB6_ASPOZ|nr:Ribosomal protein S27E [Aspergillus oryzae]
MRWLWKSPFRKGPLGLREVSRKEAADWARLEMVRGKAAGYAKTPERSIVLAVDLLNPTPQAEARKHKLKQLVPAPRSFFMDVKCPGCFTITTVFSHAQTVVVCAGCSTVLCQPTGGKARLTEGCSFRRK